MFRQKCGLLRSGAAGEVGESYALVHKSPFVQRGSTDRGGDAALGRDVDLF